MGVSKEWYGAAFARWPRKPILGASIGVFKREFIQCYALQHLFSRYKLQLPDPEILKREIEAERRRLEQRAMLKKES